MSKPVNISKKSSIPSEHRTILKKQRINEDSPGTILHDFETLLEFIGSEGCKVSPKNNFLPVKLLAELNAAMSNPIRIDIGRPMQKSYPHINGLYLLVRASGLSYIRGGGTKQLLALDDDICKSWHQLNPTERYFTLMEIWLLRIDPEILRDQWGYFERVIAVWSNFFQKIHSEKGLKIAGNKDGKRYDRYPGLYTIALLEMFGLISVQHGNPEKGKGWCIEKIHRTPLGNALQILLNNSLKISDYFQRYGEIGPGDPFGELQPALKPFFPEWHNNLKVPKHEFQDGTYIFKVSLGKIWRRIAIQGKMTLERLSTIILNAYKFGFDHLYCFTYTNRSGTATHINHPYMEDGPFRTDKFLIGDLPLSPGQSMTFLYDFGDNWMFKVQLEQVDPGDSKMKKPVILESQGKAPKQYEHWDDEE